MVHIIKIFKKKKKKKMNRVEPYSMCFSQEKKLDSCVRTPSPVPWKEKELFPYSRQCGAGGNT